jgi:hypothetical protein
MTAGPGNLAEDDGMEIVLREGETLTTEIKREQSPENLGPEEIRCSRRNNSGDDEMQMFGLLNDDLTKLEVRYPVLL